MKKFISSLVALSVFAAAAPVFAQEDEIPAYEESLDDMALEDDTFKEEEVPAPTPVQQKPKAKEVKKAVKKMEKKPGKKAAKAKSKNQKKSKKK